MSIMKGVIKMDLMKKILLEALKTDMLSISMGGETLECNEIIESKSHEILMQIKEKLENIDIEDFECIDEIIRILEMHNIAISGRHDF